MQAFKIKKKFIFYWEDLKWRNILMKTYFNVKQSNMIFSWYFISVQRQQIVFSDCTIVINRYTIASDVKMLIVAQSFVDINFTHFFHTQQSHENQTHWTVLTIARSLKYHNQVAITSHHNRCFINWFIDCSIENSAAVNWYYDFASWHQRIFCFCERLLFRCKRLRKYATLNLLLLTIVMNLQL